MKIKKYNEKYSKKLKKIDKKPKKIIDIKWVLSVTLIAFIISICFSSITEILTKNINIIIGIILLITIIFIGVMFDMIGVSATACDMKSFNSMSSKKIKGSKTAIYLIKNAEKVSAFCNDVVGDVCGIISGSIGIILSSSFTNLLSINGAAITLLITAIIAALTIGGKACGKSYAINKSDVIIYRFAKVICIFKSEK